MTSPLTILQGSALDLLKTLPDESVHCCVTSPPYWGLRDYSACSCAMRRNAGTATLAEAGTITDGASGQSSATDPRCKKEPDPACPKCHGTGKIAGVAEHQLGLEKTPEEYIAKMVAIFSEVRRVLRKDATCWVNLGDSYAGSWGNYGGGDRGAGKQRLIKTGSQAQNPVWEGLEDYRPVNSFKHPTIKPKDMVGIPWMLAFALRQPYRVPCCVRSDIDRAWLAAMFDGEGHIGIRRFDSYRKEKQQVYQDGFVVCTAVTNNDRCLLERCSEITGYDAIYLKQKAGHTDKRLIVSRRDSYGWRHDSNKAVDVIRAIYPFLIAKKRQACVAYTLDTLNKMGHGSKSVPAEIQEKKRFLWELIKKLNQRETVDIPSWIEEPKEKVEPGWYLRSEIIWAKKNTMPESVTDRPTKSHEQIFLLAKSSSYFYDHTAILEPCSTSTHARISQDLQNQIGTFRANGGGKTNGPLKPVYTKVNGPNSRMMRERTPEGDDGKPNPSRSAVRPKVAEAGDGYVKANESFERGTCMPVAARNKRDVWFVGTQPYSEAHFATFPPDLIKPCILAGTSARGCCPACGAPWERLITSSGETNNRDRSNNCDFIEGVTNGGNASGIRTLSGATYKPQREDTGKWEPTCTCPLENPVPCTVLDPFAGSFTTCMVALEFGRYAIGLEINPEYIELGKTRCNTTQGLALA